MAKLRNVGPLSTIYVVDPKGRIRYYRVAAGVKHRVIQHEPGGEVELSAKGHKDNWALLSDLYSQDEDEEIRERGYGVWEAYNQREGVGDPFPDEWFPAEVIRRRKDAEEKEKAPFKAPARTIKAKTKKGDAD